MEVRSSSEFELLGLFRHALYHPSVTMIYISLDISVSISKSTLCTADVETTPAVIQNKQLTITNVSYIKSWTHKFIIKEKLADTKGAIRRQ